MLRPGHVSSGFSALMRAWVVLWAAVFGGCTTVASGGTRPAAAGGADWVEQTLASLTLQEKVSQLVMPWAGGEYAAVGSPEFDRLREWVEAGVGGLVFSVGQPLSYAAKLNRLQALAGVPLLVASDMENGPGMRMGGIYSLPDLLPQGGGTVFPPLMALGATGSDSLAYALGHVLGREARAVGVHLTFGPVLDVNSNPLNPVINTRSLGEDPADVSRLAAAYIRGAHAAGLMTTGKHFPGHGDTEVDSHVALPVVAADRARLDSVDLPPFRAAIEAGTDAIMLGHIAMVGVDGADAGPVTVTPGWVSMLREEMGFDGVVFTDAMTMRAVSARYGPTEPLVLAIEAGADVLLMPRDVGEAIQAVVGAVESGRIAESRIDASVRRVLRAKVQAGLPRARRVDLDTVDRTVGTRAHGDVARDVAERSMTLAWDRTGLVPLAPLRVLSVTYAGLRDLTAGRTFDAELVRGGLAVESVRVGGQTSAAELAALEPLVDAADVVVVSTYVSRRSGEGAEAVEEAFSPWVERLARAGAPVVAVAFGSPYVVEATPSVPASLLAWGGAEVSQRAAARALAGQAPITGRLPISLTHAPRGTGLQRAACEGPCPPAARTAASEPHSDTSKAAERIVAPESVGMSPDLGARLDAVVEAGLADGAAPGAALAVGRHGRVVYVRGYGRLDWAPGAAAADAHTLWDLASLTKVIGTTTAAMILEEEGRLDIDRPVRDYLPAFDAPDKRAITVRMLLTHRGGLEAFAPLYRELRGPDAYLEAINARPLRSEPGTATVYSDWDMVLVQRVLEQITGQGLDTFLSERVFVPLGMRDTGFRPGPGPRVAPTQVDSARGGLIVGEVHDPNAWAIGGVAGHAGLFSSAADLAVFARMMLGGGEVDGVRILTPETIARWTARQDAGSSRGLGWDTPSGVSSAGRYFSARSFGHTGYTGTSIWMDPERGLFVILLTNRVNPTDQNQKHVALRRAVADAAQEAIVDVP